MISRSLKEMIKGRWREFKREPSAMFFVVFMPVVWMVILGLAFSNKGPEKYTIGLTTEDARMAPDLADKIRGAAGQSTELTLVEGPETELTPLMKRGEVILHLQPASSGQLSYYYDPNNPEAERAKRFTNDLLQQYLGRQDPLPTMSKPVTVVGSRYIDFLIPGLLALSLFTSSLFGTGMTIVANRRENLLKRYCATPMSPWEYILSHIIGRYFIFVVEFSMIMLAGWCLFDFSVQGRWFDLIAASVVATASFTSIGILCGARTNSTATYNGLNNLLTLPMMMMAGVWFARTGFPGWLTAIVDFFPLTAAVDALRKICLEGAGLVQVSFELCVLLGYCLICTVVSKVSFRWY